MIMLAYAVRRLPYALRSCVAALQQVHVSLEEAAESIELRKRSLDASRGRVRFHLVVGASVPGEPRGGAPLRAVEGDPVIIIGIMRP
jgi:iron(III) transport system permease protein